MSTPRRPVLRALLPAALLALAAHAQATTVSIDADNSWYAFNVNDLDSQTFGVEWIDNADSMSPDFGSALSFQFTVAAGYQARLTVVDAGFAGDTFQVLDHGLAIGSTSAVASQDWSTAPDAGTDFDGALANAAFSQGVFTFGAGQHVITGLLAQSVLDGGAPLNSTVGALRLEVTAVPEPATALSLLAGLGLLGAAVRRRRS